MAGYTPAFSSLYDGTLSGRWPTAPVWASLLPLIDANGHIAMTYEAICARTGWPMDLLRQGITELMQPDPESQSPAEGGRRLVLIDPARSWGWRAVNHQQYREKARKQNYDRSRVNSGTNKERMRDRNGAGEGATNTANSVNSPDAQCTELPLTRDDPRRPAMTRDIPRSPATTRADPLSDSDSDSDTNTSREEIYIGTSSKQQTKKRASTRAARPLEPEELGEFRIAYPPRAGSQPWRRAIAQIRTRFHEGHTWAQLIDGAARYRRYCEFTRKVGTEYVMQVATFVGPDKHFLLDWEFPSSPPEKETADQKSLRRLIDRRGLIGLADFRLPRDNETAKEYGAAQDDEWNKRKLAESRKRAPVVAAGGTGKSVTALDITNALPTPPRDRERGS